MSAPDGLSEHCTEVDGIKLCWAMLGEATDRTPVVLLHGLNNSRLSWSSVAPLLAKDRRVFVVDLPGHGDSDRPDAGYELDWYAHVVARWLEAVGIECADVVGHSFGGGVAQMLLLECPERVRRLVLVAAGGLGKAVGVPLRLASLPFFVERMGQPFMALGTRLALRGVGGKFSAEDLAHLVRFNSMPGTARAFARTVRDVIDWKGQRRNFLHRAHEVKSFPPVLVVWGDRDTLIPVEQGREFAKVLRGSFLQIFQGAGHYLHNERPEEFAAVVRRFLDNPSVRPTKLAPVAVEVAAREASKSVLPPPPRKTGAPKCVLSRSTRAP
jgi:pimeloyl-ACP methyl ester carboxylesterase